MIGFMKYIQNVGLIDKAAFALRRRCNSENATEVAIVNRALQCYDAVQAELEKGHELLFRNAEGRVAVWTVEVGRGAGG